MSRSAQCSLAAAVLPLVLGLTACSDSTDTRAALSTASGTSTSAKPSTSPSPGLAGVRVIGGSAMEPPILTLASTPLRVSGQQNRVLEAGTGAIITADTKLDVNYLLVNGRDGRTRRSAWGPNKTQSVTVGAVPQFAALVGQRVGARVLIAMPATQAYPPTGANPELRIGADDTVLFLIAPVAVHAALPRAQGSAVAPKPGLPTVTMGAGLRDPATFTLPKGGEPPTATVAQPLIIGHGPSVVAGQSVRVSYTGVTWRDPRTPFDHSGKTAAGYVELPVGQGRLIKAWDEQLVGRRVGTRLLLVVPPADGYGSAGQGDAIRGDDTLIFVVDILAAD